MAKQKPQRLDMSDRSISVVGSAYHPDMGRSSGTSIARESLAAFNHACSFFPKNRVIYIPGHAQGDRNHKDCERGVVVSRGPMDNIFVKFDRDVQNLVFDDATAKSCDPKDLVHEND